MKRHGDVRRSFLGAAAFGVCLALLATGYSIVRNAATIEIARRRQELREQLAPFHADVLFRGAPPTVVCGEEVDDAALVQLIVPLSQQRITRLDLSHACVTVEGLLVLDAVESLEIVNLPDEGFERDDVERIARRHPQWRIMWRRQKKS